MTWHIKTERGWQPWLAAIPVCGNSNDLQGVFRAQTLEEVRSEIGPRLKRFLHAMENLGPPGNQGPLWNGKHFAEPIVGAFGEKLT